MVAEKTITLEQAYDAMYAYMDALYQRTKNDDLAVLLGGMSRLADGGTADPAAWQDWLRYVDQAVAGAVDTRLKAAD